MDETVEEKDQLTTNMQPLNIKVFGCFLYADIPARYQGKWVQKRVKQISEIIERKFNYDPVFEEYEKLIKG